MKIRVILLCAGYGTRFSKDLEDDKNYSFTCLRGIPKPLLPVGSGPLISHWFDILSNVPSVSEIVVVTNDLHKLYYESFLGQLRDFNKPVAIISDGSLDNETRSGAVACMQMGFKGTQSDALIIAGDTLFDKEFNLNEMIFKYAQLKRENENFCLLISAPVFEENMSKHGIIEVEPEGRVSSFLEKPEPHETDSRLQSPCFYMMPRRSFSYIDEFLESTEGLPMSQRDATGNFIMYYLSKAPVFAYPVHQRFDIGNLKSYIECCHNFNL